MRPFGSEGALAITNEGCWYATAPRIEVVSTVGSGDALLAGLVVAQLEGECLETALASGVACGAANALTLQPGRFERCVMEALLKRTNVEKI
jgi:fructose-1-phosphate kinase PfkB-like protein